VGRGENYLEGAQTDSHGQTHIADSHGLHYLSTIGFCGYGYLIAELFDNLRLLYYIHLLRPSIIA